jgi:hypothetical protein
MKGCKVMARGSIRKGVVSYRPHPILNYKEAKIYLNLPRCFISFVVGNMCRDKTSYSVKKE